MTRSAHHVGLVLLLAGTVLGCSSPESASGPAGGASPAAAPTMGTFEIAGTSQPFRVITCDLPDGGPNGLLLRGSGTMPDGTMLTPDGRRLGVEVEKLAPGLGGTGMLYERVTVQFGGFQDEDGWEATATSLGGDRWTSQDHAALDGPIIQVDGNDLVVTATFGALSGNAAEIGTLRVTCPSDTSTESSR